MASGLEGFLGCPAVLYEAALVDFGSVRDGLVLENILNLELDESSEFPSSKILTERTIHRYIVLNDKVGAEEAADAPKMETIGAGTGVGDQQLHSFVTADSRTDAAADYFVEEPKEVEMSDDEQSVDERIDADEAMSLEDILLSFPVDVLLPSAGVDFTKIILGKDIKIPGVDERTWYLASLPQIPVDDKGKEPLMEKDPVKGNPVKEQFVDSCRHRVPCPAQGEGDR
ncbi:hypothetical protein F511_38887 [Dorcoceras hygrometricum]|uniref:Uncharacterized protein n=1 Tax=Dorcoceras hygrometricum TaxID=472368 RepID=A0A2Z7CX41_9LAMI|nr:hypothetical protein F511_38887 [Dorcoceras hygrometricum]